MSIAETGFTEVQGFLPAKACMVCEKPIEAIGGRRLVAQKAHGSNVFNQAITGGFENFHSCTRLLEGRDLYLVLWGGKSFLTDDVIARIKAQYLQGFRPWFCQVCGKRLCHICREILPRPVASDYVFDDGGIVHCPILGADPGCWNPECERHRPDQIRPDFL